MNRDEILNMEAGREMDALIATEVLGWRVDDMTAVSPSGSRNSRIHGGGDDWLEYYSTDMEAAWKVAEKLDLGMLNNVHGRWEAYFPNNKHADAKTAALAICRAALLCICEDVVTYG